MLRVSVIVPVYNESAIISDCVEHVQGLGADEVIVVDGGSADGTAELVEGRAQVLRATLGRGPQLNTGARIATGDILLFLHADARLGPEALEHLREAMENPAIVGGNFRIRFDGRPFPSSVLTSFAPVGRRIGIFYGDTGIFCRRAVFEQLGGYRDWPIMEDYDFARRLWRHGRLAYLRDPIYVSDRRWRQTGALKTIATWLFIHALYYAGVSPQRLAGLYRHIR